MSTESREPSEEELRVAYEAEVKKVRVEHILLDNVITLANLGMRKTGMAPGTEDERDPDQVRLAIESIRALIPIVEQTAPEQVGPIREAVSQLQLAFVRIGGAAAETGSVPQSGGGSEPRGPGESAPEPSKTGEPGPAQRSGQLWVPGQ
jgi:hypothetical protein